MTSNVMANAKGFIYRHARLLDRRRYEFLFEHGSQEAVLSALRAYQNENGGFGHALEPDIRCPYSQPVPTEVALTIIDEVAAEDSELLEGILRYLRSIALPEGGLPFVHRSVLEYPHAPWWNADRDDAPQLNPTGNIIGFLWKLNLPADVYEQDWFKKSVEFVWHTMDNIEHPGGYHDGIQWVTFLKHCPDQEKAVRYMKKLDRWLSGAIEREVHTEGYVQKILDWAPLSDSYARKFVTDDEVNVHLDALLEEQQADGGWAINWQALSPVVEFEWRGHLTVERLKTLQSYGRL